MHTFEVQFPKQYLIPRRQTWRIRLRNRTIQNSGFAAAVERKVFKTPMPRKRKQRPSKISNYPMAYLSLIVRLRKRSTLGTTIEKHRAIVAKKVASSLNKVNN